MLKFSLPFLFFMVCFLGRTQADSSSVFKLDLEFRPRFEFRDGYENLPSTNTDPAFFVSSRSRLSVNFNRRRSHFHASGQDVRIWGQNGSSPATNSFSFFEVYADFGIRGSSYWNLKVGRQAVELDNGRLFSKANWNQFSRAHDGLRLSYSKYKLKTNFLFFYNQSSSNSFGTFYNLNTYKYLAIHFLEYSISDKIHLNILNSFDGYQSLSSQNTVYVRGTSGGRISYKTKTFGATIAAYYQYGQLQSGQSISAYYLQPELAFKIKRLRIRAGMEYISGSDNGLLTTASHSFSTLFGVAFKFNGHLNYFTSFPDDVNGAGLINPYLFFDYKLTQKFRFKLENHLFYAQSELLAIDNSVVNPYLGFETDVKLKYELNTEIDFDFGISTMVATASLETLKTGDYRKKPLFAFLMFTWKPSLFTIKSNFK